MKLHLHLPWLAAFVSLSPLAAETVQQAYLKSPTTSASDWFSRAVAISGDTAVVGAWYDSSVAFNAGAVFIYVRTGGTWTLQQTLRPSNTRFCANFGGAVAISGDTVVVGARLERSGSTGVNGNQLNEECGSSGAAYVFTRSGGTWTQEAYLKASNTGTADYFGSSVAVSGDTIVVGATGEDCRSTGVNALQSDNSSSNAGAAYVFRKSAGTWEQEAYLKASNTAAEELFGWGVALDGATLVVSAAQERGNPDGSKGTVESGAAYVFRRQGGSWSQQAYLKSPQPSKDGLFGNGVAVSGDTVVVGESGGSASRDGERIAASGTAHVFRETPGGWQHDAILTASNAGAGHAFGEKVGIDGDRIIVGAPRESGDASGVDGDPADQRGIASGAAYLFERGSTGDWLESGYLKASNNGAGDQFGRDVAVSGDSMMVASWYEDSSATNVDGFQDYEGAANSGAAYVFGPAGSASAARMAVRPGGEGSISSGATLSLGVTPAGTPRELAFHIANTGGTALTGLSAAIESDAWGVFSIVSQPEGTVAPGESGVCVVRFLSPSAGGKQAVLRISAANAPDFRVTLKANYFTQIETWRQAKFGHPGNQGERHDEADPDGDGVANLLEYAFNLEPTLADRQVLDSSSNRRGLPLVRMVATPYPHLRVDYIRRKLTTNPGIYCVPQHSTTLGDDWAAFQGVLNITSIDSTWERVSIDFWKSGPRQFARVFLLRQ